MVSSARQLGRSLGRLWKAVSQSRQGADSRPRPDPLCEFGLVVDQRLKDLQADVVAIKRLLLALLLAVVGALVGLVADLLGAI